MINNRLRITILGVALALILGTHALPFAPKVLGNSIIGLGVTGWERMEFTAEKDVGQLEGYISVINDGGTVIGYYNVSIEGQIAGLAGWNVTINPETFALEPDKSQKVNVYIECPEVTGEFTGGLRVSAYAEQAEKMGTGVAEILVPVKVKLTPLGINTQTTGQGSVTYITKPEIFTTENPAVINAKSDVGCTIIITGISKPCKITAENMTSLPTDVTPPSSSFKVVGKYLKIAVNTTVTLNAVLKIYYDPEQLKREGLDARALKLSRWDGEWKLVESQINIAENYVSATITKLSYWALMVQLPEPFYAQWWFWVAIVSTIALTVFLLERRGFSSRKKG